MKGFLAFGLLGFGCFGKGIREDEKLEMGIRIHVRAECKIRSWKDIFQENKKVKKRKESFNDIRNINFINKLRIIDQNSNI